MLAPAHLALLTIDISQTFGTMRLLSVLIWAALVVITQLQIQQCL